MLKFLTLCISGVMLGCIYGLIALGYGLIYKASGLICPPRSRSQPTARRISARNMPWPTPVSPSRWKKPTSARRH